MKLLFIGEGPHDVGASSSSPFQPRLAGGTVPTLARRICADIGEDSVALAWREIRRFEPPSKKRGPSAKKRGFPSKVTAAVLIATRRFGCAGSVVVADRDGDDRREAELQEGAARVAELFPGHPLVWGLSIESVEAWTLGAPEKIAEELGVEVELVRQQYPRGVDVESLSEKSGKPDHRPKQLLERIARLKHLTDSTEFRAAIAERTDVASLERACPLGFAPFANRLRKEFLRAS